MLVSDVHQSDSVIYSSDGKDAACNTEDVGLIPGSGRSPGEESGYPLQYSCLGNSMGRGAWWATVHGITKESDMTEKLTLSLFFFQILFPFRFYIHLFRLFRLWIFSSVTWRNNYSHRDFSKKSMREFTKRTYPRLWHQIIFKSTVVSSQGLQTEGGTTVCRFLGTVARNLTLSLSPVMIQASFNSVVFIPEYWIQVSYQFSSSGGSAVKKIHLPAQETWVWSLGWEDPLEEEMAAHSSIIAWEILWTEELGRLQGAQRVRHDWTHRHTQSYQMP